MKRFINWLFGRKNKELMKNETTDEQLSRKELENKLLEVKKELLREKNKAASEKNYQEALKEKEKLQVEADEWLKTQPAYKIRITLLSGKQVYTEVFKANASVNVVDLQEESDRNWGYHHGYFHPYDTPRRHEARLHKVEAKINAENTVREFRRNEARVGDLTIPLHAIESFEIVKAKK